MKLQGVKPRHKVTYANYLRAHSMCPQLICIISFGRLEARHDTLAESKDRITLKVILSFDSASVSNS